MNKGIKVILMILVAAGLSLVLTLIDSNMDINEISQLYVPTVFATIIALSIFFPNIKRYLLMLSFGFMLLMLAFYFGQQIDISNWFGSLGFGALILIVISYLPKLVKNGYIDRF